MRVAVTGLNGQVVTSLLANPHGNTIIALGRPQLDLADPASVLAAITAAKPDVVVSAAAYTAVDNAESEPDLAFAINGAGAGAVAQAAAQLGVPVVHISTDYVFDGSKTAPYDETDPTAPLGVYGASKWAGEQAVAAATDDYAILRTAWVYSPYGNNFVKTMLRLAQTRDGLNVVADQVGNPTSALDIADGILQVAQNLVQSGDPALRGTFHMTGSGEASWADFAGTIFAEAALHGAPSALVTPIPASAYPTPAPRPANSRLSCAKLRSIHGVSLPLWQTSLGVVLNHLIPTGEPS